jgi:putative membrane protein
MFRKTRKNACFGETCRRASADLAETLGEGGMRLFMGLGKVVALLFWLVVIVNLVSPFAKPFDMLLNGAGILLILVHLFEIMLFNSLLRGRANPWLDRLQLLLFGVFHLLGIPRHGAKESGHA